MRAPAEALVARRASNVNNGTVLVSVPQGAKAGDVLEFDVDGARRAKVSVPANVVAGSRLKVSLAAATVATAPLATVSAAPQAPSPLPVSPPSLLPR